MSEHARAARAPSGAAGAGKVKGHLSCEDAHGLARWSSGRERRPHRTCAKTDTNPSAREDRLRRSEPAVRAVRGRQGKGLSSL